MGRPPKPLLGRELIGETALRLIDEEGSDSFGLNRLAAKMSVRSSSLYNHISSKDDIVQLVRHLVVAQIDYSMFASQPWDQALEAWARSYRDAFAAHPNTIKILATTPIRDESTLVMYEHVIGNLLGAGWPTPSVMSAVTAVESFILGSVLDLSAPEQMVLATSSTATPHLAAALIGVHPQTARRRADADFELGLRAILSGLRHELSLLSTLRTPTPSGG
jgi:AcrR family transcriptional regulator